MFIVTTHPRNCAPYGARCFRWCLVINMLLLQSIDRECHWKPEHTSRARLETGVNYE